MPRSDKPLSTLDVLNRVLDFDNSRLNVDLSELPAAAALGDALANPTTSIIGAALLDFDGTNWSRLRNNLEVTVLASAARTTSTNSADQTNFNARGIMVWLNITAVPGTDNVSLKIVVKDPVSGNTISLLTSATFTTTGIRTFVVYPGAGTTASADITASAQFPLPRTWRIEMVHSAASSFTYSVGACYIN